MPVQVVEEKPIGLVVKRMIHQVPKVQIGEIHPNESLGISLLKNFRRVRKLRIIPKTRKIVYQVGVDLEVEIRILLGKIHANQLDLLLKQMQRLLLIMLIKISAEVEAGVIIVLRTGKLKRILLKVMISNIANLDPDQRPGQEVVFLPNLDHDLALDLVPGLDRELNGRDRDHIQIPTDIVTIEIDHEADRKHEFVPDLALDLIHDRDLDLVNVPIRLTVIKILLVEAVLRVELIKNEIHVRAPQNVQDVQNLVIETRGTIIIIVNLTAVIEIIRRQPIDIRTE